MALPGFMLLVTDSWLFLGEIMHRLLARLYAISGALGALCIVIIMTLVVAQVSLNAITKIGSYFVSNFPSLSIPSYSDFAGYLLVGASFLALPYAMHQGGHIRVNLLLQFMGKKRSFFFELWASGLCAIVAGTAAYYTVRMAYNAWRFNDVSFGLVKIPLWIPQSAMALGLIIFTICLIDCLVQLIRRGTAPYIENAHDELSAE